MAINFNGATLATNINAVVFNGTAVSKVMFNGTEVWAKAADITFTLEGGTYGCNSFSTSGNTFAIGGGALIAYTKATGFTGSTGSVGNICGSTLYTSSGQLRMTGGSSYVDIEYISSVPYFRGSSYTGSKGLMTSRNTNPQWQLSYLYADGSNGDYSTNMVKIAR